MTIRAKKFTPEVLLSAPRRSAGIPNHDGSKALYSVSTYSFEDHKSFPEIRILDIKSQESKQVTDAKGAGELNWVDEINVLMLCDGEEGKTKVCVGDPEKWEKSHSVVGTISGPASNVKLVKLDGESKYAVTFTAESTPKGELYNPETASKPVSSARLYKEAYVRHWDTWLTPNKNTIFYGTLSKKGGNDWKLSHFTNALKGTNLESPFPPFGGADHYDVSTKGIMFVAKDPDLKPTAIHTKMNVYLLNISSFDSKLESNPIHIQVSGMDGMATSPVFSQDGKSAAFLKMRQDGYESDKLQLFVIPDVARPLWVVHVFATPDQRGKWDRSPQSVAWDGNSKMLYLVAEEEGKSRLWAMSVDDLLHADLPKAVKSTGSIADVRVLSDGNLFLSGNSLIDNSIYHVVDRNGQESKVVSSSSRNGSMFGLQPSQVDEFWWDGASKGQKVHALVVKPSNFSEKERYPLAFLIHGGPQGAWNDSWSTRWNPAVFAEQGYIAVCPNPTGSTGYGQGFTDAITGEWGGLPYQDLVNGFEYMENEVPYIDTSRAIALGASYGGYMMNWIQGHPLGRKFQAIVNHDGVFNMAAQLASEELWFPYHDLGGPLWRTLSTWQKWDPSAHLDKWETPMLVIHSELDYRLTIAEGLSAFNVLQTKGIESQFLSFPDENHWVLKPENSRVWHRVVLDWMNEHVGLKKYSDSAEGRVEGEEPIAEAVEDTRKRVSEMSM